MNKSLAVDGENYVKWRKMQRYMWKDGKRRAWLRILRI